MSGFLCTLPLIAKLLTGCDAALPLATGYVEGEYVLIAPVEVARIDSIAIKRGDVITANMILGQMESADAGIAVRQAQAALSQAESQLDNLKEGKRPEEIAVIEALLGSAKAQEAEARRVFTRQKDLRDRGIAPQSAYDEASTALDLSISQVAVNSANLAVAKLPARNHEIAAAEAAVQQARASVDNAGWRLDHRTLKAPASGVVEDVIRRAGEMAGPSQPILSMLPDGAIKLRLYAAEPKLSHLAIATKLSVRCDGCGEDLSAEITYISDSPEFTPPVIYSIENRQKLVYLIEARPLGDATKLKPGQIVDVVLGDKQP